MKNGLKIYVRLRNEYTSNSFNILDAGFETALPHHQVQTIPYKTPLIYVYLINFVKVYIVIYFDKITKNNNDQ